jgi:hypothetical protein
MNWAESLRTIRPLSATRRAMASTISNWILPPSQAQMQNVAALIPRFIELVRA